MQTDEGERLYFVVETKSSLYADDLRQAENAKIHCGKAHFRPLAEGTSPAKYVSASTVNDMLAHAEQD